MIEARNTPRSVLVFILRWLQTDARWIWVIPIVGFLNALGIQWLSRTGVLRTDDWSLWCQILDRLLSGSISWDFLCSQYGETRPILVRLLMLCEYFITGRICTMFTMVISELFTLGMVIIIVQYLKSKLAARHTALLFILASLTSTLMETPINIDQIQWWGLFCYKGCIFGMLLVCYTAAQYNVYVTRMTFWIGLILAIGSHGYWILLLPILILFSLYKWRVGLERRHATLFINLGVLLPMMALLGWLFFTGHYTTKTQAIWSTAQLLESPSRWLYLYFGTLANPFHFALSTPFADMGSIQLGIMTVIGMIGALFCGGALIQSLHRGARPMDNLAVLFIISGFTFAGALMLGRGQITQGFYPITVFHYVILFVPFWIAFFWLVLSRYDKRPRLGTSFVLPIMTVFLLVNAIYAGTQVNRQMVRDIKKAGFVLVGTMHENDSIALKFVQQSIIHPTPVILLESARWLEKRDLLPTPVP